MKKLLISVQRKWLFKYGGEAYGEERNRIAYELDIVKDFLFAPEYTIMDAYNILRGGYFSAYNLWDDMLAIDFINEVPRLDLPVYFLMGRHDWVTVYPLVEQFYETLDAPHKELIWFDYSAHSPNFEEPEKFNQEVIRIKEETYPDM